MGWYEPLLGPQATRFPPCPAPRWGPDETVRPRVRLTAAFAQRRVRSGQARPEEPPCPGPQLAFASFEKSGPRACGSVARREASANYAARTPGLSVMITQRSMR